MFLGQRRKRRWHARAFVVHIIYAASGVLEADPKFGPTLTKTTAPAARFKDEFRRPEFGQTSSRPPEEKGGG